MHKSKKWLTLLIILISISALWVSTTLYTKNVENEYKKLYVESGKINPEPLDEYYVRSALLSPRFLPSNWELESLTCNSAKTSRKFFTEKSLTGYGIQYDPANCAASVAVANLSSICSQIDGWFKTNAFKEMKGYKNEPCIDKSFNHIRFREYLGTRLFIKYDKLVIQFFETVRYKKGNYGTAVGPIQYH